MFCKECGKVIDDDSFFCKHCGRSQQGGMSVEAEEVKWEMCEIRWASNHRLGLLGAKVYFYALSTGPEGLKNVAQTPEVKTDWSDVPGGEVLIEQSSAA
ncbi:MAG TPA: hypothetical protein VFG99_09410, partial [Chloroflexia bacterium]|nr:hypothetical protein [Chloroflexia bacterium]